jgi:hypothetical protein
VLSQGLWQIVDPPEIIYQNVRSFRPTSNRGSILSVRITNDVRGRVRGWSSNLGEFHPEASRNRA